MRAAAALDRRFPGTSEALMAPPLLHSCTCDRGVDLWESFCSKVVPPEVLLPGATLASRRLHQLEPAGRGGRGLRLGLRGGPQEAVLLRASSAGSAHCFSGWIAHGCLVDFL